MHLQLLYIGSGLIFNTTGKVMRITQRVILNSILPRLLILVVTTWNLLCAIQFILFAQDYASSFDLLPDVTGRAVIQSIGILFMMWNIPYFFAFLHPYKWYIALISATLMQLTGLVGEIWIKSQLQHPQNMVSSIQRFIIFDAIGLILLVSAVFLVWHKWRKNEI